MSYDPGNIFARILRGELPSKKVYEDPHVLAEGLASHRWIGLGGHRLTVRAIKQQIDGALGSHTAWLCQPYADAPDRTGNCYLDADAVTEHLMACTEAGVTAQPVISPVARSCARCALYP